MMRRPRASLLVVLGAVALIAAAPATAPVADAAMRGDQRAVRHLLQQGADVNAAQGDGMTALHWAAERGDVETAEMLVYAGANVDAVTRIGANTPLHVAAKVGSAPLVELLLTAGADVGVTSSTTGATPLHLAAASGDAAAVSILLEHGADADARESQWGQTPLIFAAWLNRAAAIEALLTGGADPAIASSTLDLLHYHDLDRAANARQQEVLDTILADQTVEGQEPPIPSASQVQVAIRAGRDAFLSGEIPEKAASSENEFDFRRPSGIDTKGGLTPLLHAARQGHVEATLALLDGGANVNQVGLGDDTSPLLMATINGQFDLALLLLERGADPNLAARINGATPLLAAVNAQWQPRTRFPQPQEIGLQKTNYLDLMRALLEAGADPDARLSAHPWYMVYSGCGNANCGLVNTVGATAFFRAAYATDIDAMRVLIEYGADPNIPTEAPPPRRRRRRPENAPRPQAGSLLGSLAVLNGEERPQTPTLEIDPFTGDAINPDGTDPSGLPAIPPGGPGVYALHAASGVGYGEGFAGNAHRHAPDAWLSVVKYLIEELGVDVNLRDHNGYNAIHHAAARGDNEMIAYLVERGGDVTAVSRRGQTTADMANGPVQRVSPFPDTVALLESLGAINNHNCRSC